MHENHALPRRTSCWTTAAIDSQKLKKINSSAATVVDHVTSNEDENAAADERNMQNDAEKMVHKLTSH